VGAQDPVIRQTMLQGTSYLTADKPLALGSLEIPGSTRRMDIAVVMEPIKLEAFISTKRHTPAS
jgi:hypothetical protein